MVLFGSYTKNLKSAELHNNQPQAAKSSFLGQKAPEQPLKLKL